MKLHYLGTAAAERVPGIFCHCSVCEHARKNKGRNIRTQTQTLIDDGKLLIDFPGDTYLHILKNNLDFSDIEHLLITHWHSDHLYAEDLAFRMSPYGNDLTKSLTVYGSAFSEKFFNRAFELENLKEENRVKYCALQPFQAYKIGDYTVHVLPAEHGNFQEDCFIYVIDDGEKRIFYTHDTGFPKEEVFDYLVENKLSLDLISFDCTGQGLEQQGGSHMNFKENIRLYNKLLKNGLVHEGTKKIISHFSHNGGLNYEEMSLLGEKEKMITAYDGMIVEV